ncbi:unnamed protein product [Vicia faba]|uniref:CCHC-type domain-containing protein n=1 Tax=Vicia faba TaxID=3906 RepID=A0AAV1ALL2_VICFA|nr:unnamed protein product [Vicia faba]
MTNLWDQLALMESTELKVVKAYTNQREEQRLVQFLMALRDDFEGLRGDKGVLSTPQSVFVAPSYKGKPQGRVGLGIDECVFCKEKGHWKTQCPKLKACKKNFKRPSSNVVVAASTTIGSGSDHAYTSETTSQISDIAEQLQNLLVTKPHTMYASSIKGLNSSYLSGSSFREADWDRS